MNVKVVRTFASDKRLYYAKEVLDIPKEKVDYFNSSPNGILVEALDDQEEIAVELKENDNIDYEKFTKKKLVEIAKDKSISLDAKMTKDEIIKELVKWI